jgi:hypothetical protein
MNLARTLPSLVLASLALGAHVPADAQEAGVYNGTTSDGNGVSFTVIQDPNSGDLVLTSVGDGFNANCKKTGTTVGYGIGTGDYTVITGTKITRTYAYINFYEKITINFGAGGTATGNFSADVPTYVDSATNFKTQSCGSDKMTFTASIGSDAAARDAVKALPAAAGAPSVVLLKRQQQ